MPKEVQGYRDEVDLIHEHFGHKNIILWKEVVEYCGMSYDWCSNHLKIPHNGCTVAQLARALAGLK